jgi:hypothetical protein
VSHLDTYRTQSGPQPRRERVQPTATGPLQSPLCVRGRRNPARDPRFPITADHALPHTPPSIQQQAGLRAPSPAQPPRGRPRQGPRRLRQTRRPGRRCVAQPSSQIGGCLFSNSPLTHSQTNTRCLSPTRGATRVAHVIARYRPRSRRDAPVDGPPMGLPSGARVHGRMHASRRASRASFRASLSSETLNSERSLAFPCLFGCESEHDFSPSSRRTSSTHPSIHTSIRC